jgi:hypothetical protein
MARSFNTNSGRSAFGVFKEPNTSGDYVLNKKSKSTFCSRNKRICCNTFSDQSNLLSAKKLNTVNYKLINTSDLDINLITELNLKDVNVFQTFGMSSEPFFYYNIDPSGQLFGNTTCGINNFLHYSEYTPPYNNPNPGHIDNL